MASTPADQPRDATQPDPSATDRVHAAEMPTAPPLAGPDAPTDPDGPTAPSTPADSGSPVAPAGADPASTAVASTRRSRRLRSVLVNGLAVLACLATLVSVVAVWTHETLFDTDAWMEIVGPLADDPAITDAVGVALTDQLFEVVDAQQLATEALPERAQFLAVPLTNAVEGYLSEAVQELLQTEQFRQIWDRANRLTHAAAVQLLRGEPVAGFTVTDGTVTLNLLPLLARAMTFIDAKAPRLFGDQPIPEITAETPVDQARQELTTALGRPLPENFGVFTVLQSDQLAAAQQAVTVFDRLVYVLIGLTLILIVASLILSRRRRRTVVVLGLGIALSMVVANATVSAIEDQVVGLVGGEVQRRAAATTIASLVSSLEVSTTALAWLGLIVVVGAFLAGDSRTAIGTRRAVSSGARHARAAGSSGVGHEGGTRSVAPLPLVGQHHGAFRVGGVIATMLWLILIDITWVKLAFVLIVFGVYQAAISVLGRTTSDDTGTPDIAA